jgi:hypothetical protein
MGFLAGKVKLEKEFLRILPSSPISSDPLRLHIVLQAIDDSANQIPESNYFSLQESDIFLKDVC